MRLVDDEDAVARFRRRVVATIAQFAHVFYTVVRGRVELRDIQVAGASGGERTAAIALPAWRRGWPFDAVQ